MILTFSIEEILDKSLPIVDYWVIEVLAMFAYRYEKQMGKSP